MQMRRPIQLSVATLLLLVSTGWCGGGVHDSYSVIDLGTFGGDTFAYDMNNAGQVTGFSNMPGGFGQAFIWQSGTMSPLPPIPDATRSFGTAITESGKIAGSYETISPSSQSHAVVWQGNSFTALAGANDPFY